MSYASHMPPLVGFSVALVCIITGAVTAIRPRLISKFQEDEETSPEAAIRQVRIGAIFLLLFGAALLYSVLFEKGPVQFIGV